MVGLVINRVLVDSAFGLLSRQAARHFRSHLGGYPPRDRQQACPSDLEALHADAAICGMGFTMSFYLRDICAGWVWREGRIATFGGGGIPGDRHGWSCSIAAILGLDWDCTFSGVTPI